VVLVVTYVRLTMTSKNVDARSGKPYQWTCILSPFSAAGAIREYRDKGVKVEVQKGQDR
jgi:hypothetical protein